MKSFLWQVDIEDYAPLIGDEAVERITRRIGCVHSRISNFVDFSQYDYAAIAI